MYNIASGFQCDTKMAAVFSWMRPRGSNTGLMPTEPEGDFRKMDLKGIEKSPMVRGISRYGICSHLVYNGQQIK